MFFLQRELPINSEKIRKPEFGLLLDLSDSNKEEGVMTNVKALPKRLQYQVKVNVFSSINSQSPCFFYENQLFVLMQ